MRQSEDQRGPPATSHRQADCQPERLPVHRPPSESLQIQASIAKAWAGSSNLGLGVRGMFTHHKAAAEGTATIRAQEVVAWRFRKRSK